MSGKTASSSGIILEGIDDVEDYVSCVKNSNTLIKDGAKRGLFELPPDHHKELETELKKMAPVSAVI
uniref:Uncharacterized protein n=1 Tax=Gossypium raimondii TaxID=29730 RepID=A0A0D2V8N6_GOSRA|nr:hypothetical protein B456_010G112300 [Gossypium raimondii]